MQPVIPRPTRAHVRGLFVVPLVLAVVVLPLVRPSSALGSPVDPVPAGVWPLQPRPEVVRAFDPPDDPYGSGHRGVDLAGRVGEQVLSALPGRVSYAAPLAGRGVVVVDHGSTRTTYEPVAATVRVGDQVVRGAPIGRLELAGSHCLPAACLHWGWLRGDTYLDPLLLVGAGTIRLLPLWQKTRANVEALPGAPPLGVPAVPALAAAVPPLPYAALISRMLDPPGAGVTRRLAPTSERRPVAPAFVRPFAMRPLLT